MPCTDDNNYDVAGDVIGEIEGESALDNASVLCATAEKGLASFILAMAFVEPFAVVEPFAFALGFSVAATVAVCGGVVSASSGMVEQYVLSTCLRAGRRMGLERKKSMPESRHSC